MTAILDIQQINNGLLPKFGQVFVGVIDNDPVVNPITVFTDSGLTQALQTPLKLDFNGRPLDPNTGEVVTLYIGLGYSIQWLDQKGNNLLPEAVNVVVESFDGATFNSDNNTEALGNRRLYACVDTTSPRILTISDSTIALGSPSFPFFININDESDGAGTNNITAVCESGQTIDKQLSQAIEVDSGTLRLYANGTEVFSL